MIKDFKTIETISDDCLVKYIRISMPMMSDRDNVMQMSKKALDDGVFLSLHTVEHPAMPPNPKIVRMFNHVVTFLKQEGSDVIMHDFEYFNMKGYLPASLMNMAIASETAKEFTTMMKNIYQMQK